MTLAGKQILVTGGTGFLGGALVHRLSQEGAVVRVVARNPEKARSIQNLPRVEVVAGDITDAESMHRAVNGCEIVFHSAAALGGALENQRRLNKDGTRNVANAAAGTGVLRMVHVSSIAVYGYNVSGDVTESTPLNPGHDPYNITKAEAEETLREVAAEHRMPYTIIRPGQIYGPGSGMWTGKLFRLARIRPTPWVGNGNGFVFPIYIDDVVDLMLAAAEHPDAVGEAFNCTPDPSPTWREFLGAYSKLAGHESWLGIPPVLVSPFAAMVGKLAKPQTQFKELPNMLRLTQGRVTYTMTKARELLDWQPKVDLKTGIQNCAPWLREKGLLT
jgi:nucleoside-diphosphate-sugar epimerase